MVLSVCTSVNVFEEVNGVLIMISQPMRGRQENEIMKERDRIMRVLEKNGHVVMDTLFADSPEEAASTPLYFLSRSIEAIGRAEALYFMAGWEIARGCIIEHMVAQMYGKEIFYEDPDAENLPETMGLMCSGDYKERFAAEYLQTRIRYNRLHGMLVRLDAGTLDFTPSCPPDLLREQAAHMGQYLYDLEVRAEIEDVELP